VVLLAGGLYPILRHRPWKFAAERQAILEISRHYPMLRLMKLETLDPRQAAEARRRGDPDAPATSGWGLLTAVEVHGENIQSLTGFRRELRNHPLLSKAFAGSAVVRGGGWSIAGENDDMRIEVEFLFLP